MNNAYETIWITKSSLTDEEVEKGEKKVREIIPAAGGTVVSLESWGRRKLAYEVQKERKGVYAIVHYNGLGATVSALERHLRLNESTLKYITVRIAPEQLGKTEPIKDEKPIYRGKDSAFRPPFSS